MVEAKEKKERDDLARLRQALNEGIAEGKEEGKKEIARNLLQIGMSVEQVTSITNLSLEIVQSLTIKKV